MVMVWVVKHVTRCFVCCCGCMLVVLCWKCLLGLLGIIRHHEIGLSKIIKAACQASNIMSLGTVKFREVPLAALVCSVYHVCGDSVMAVWCDVQIRVNARLGGHHPAIPSPTYNFTFTIHPTHQQPRSQTTLSTSSFHYIWGHFYYTKLKMIYPKNTRHYYQHIVSSDTVDV